MHKPVNKNGETIYVLAQTEEEVRALPSPLFAKYMWQAISNAAFRAAKEKGTIEKWVAANPGEDVPLAVWLEECPEPESRGARGPSEADKKYVAKKLAEWNLEARSAVAKDAPDRQAQITARVDAAAYAFFGERSEKCGHTLPEWDADSREAVLEAAQRAFRIHAEKAAKEAVYA